MEPLFFNNQLEFRDWLAKNHLSERELIVGFRKVSSGKPSLTWPQSVDEAICFGWIDGIRKSIDNESYCIRFTPRNPSSNWSDINIKKAEELILKGLMQPKGLELYQKRKINLSRVYSYENKPKALPADLLRKIKENKLAWEFFDAQSPSYKKTIYYWILEAKLEKTRINRLEKLIQASEKNQKIF